MKIKRAKLILVKVLGTTLSPGHNRSYDLILLWKIYKIIVVALSCKMSKKYFEWSHQLQNVHDGSTMGTRQNKKNVIVLLCVCRKSVMWQSDNRELFWDIFQVFMSLDARVTVVLLSCHCDATLNQRSCNMQGYIRIMQQNYGRSCSTSYISVLYWPNIGQCAYSSGPSIILILFKW